MPKETKEKRAAKATWNGSRSEQNKKTSYILFELEYRHQDIANLFILLITETDLVHHKGFFGSHVLD